MSGPYNVTLLQLQPDVAGHGSVDQKVELGRVGLEDIIRLAGRLQALPPPTQPGAAPGIIVRRGEKAWRISAHQGRLRVHHGTSALDDYWTADSAANLAELPPFRAGTQASSNSASSRDPHTSRKKRSASRTAAEVVGLLVVGFVLVFVAARFGTPRRKLSAPPPGVTLVSAAEERLSIYKKLAGTYVIDKRPGNNVVTISPEGVFTYATIGKDGKPIMPPNKQEQAKAARRSEAPALVTTMGLITQADENSVVFGRARFARTAFN